MDEMKGHANMESISLRKDTEVTIGGVPAYLANETTVRAESQNVEKIRNAQGQGANAGQGQERRDEEKTGSRR